MREMCLLMIVCFIFNIFCLIANMLQVLGNHSRFNILGEQLFGGGGGGGGVCVKLYFLALYCQAI